MLIEFFIFTLFRKCCTSVFRHPTS